MLAIPYNVFHIMLLLSITRISEWLNSRALVAIWQCVWTLPCVIALRYWPDTMTNALGTYALVTVLLSDDRSANGTFLSRSGAAGPWLPVTPQIPVALVHGDRVRLGKRQLLFDTWRETVVPQAFR